MEEWTKNLFFVRYWAAKKKKKKSGKAINTYKRTLGECGWLVGLGFISFISSSFFQFISCWQVVTLPQSFVLLKSTLNYSHCFIWYCCCQSKSRWKQIREKFLGHVCETCLRILISADKVLHFYLQTWSHIESFSSRHRLNFSVKTSYMFHILYSSQINCSLNMVELFVSPKNPC